MEPLSKIIARHIASTRFEQLPPAAVAAARQSLLDALGVTLAATTLGEATAAFVDLVRSLGGTAESSVIGFGFKLPAPAAALINGAMGHALDFEDAHDAALLHPNAVAIPAALAVAQARGPADGPVSGREFLTALAIGCDLACRLGLAMQQDPAAAGWYTPPILGGFGAVAAVAKLLRLSERQIVDALSLMLCQATASQEVRYSPNSHIRAVRDAFPAQAAVLSGLLAQRGVRGFDRPLEGKAGLFALYADGRYDSATVVDQLGRHFEGVNVSFKRWPACRATHAYIEAALALAAEHRLAAADIAAVEMTGSPLNRMVWEPLAQKRRPQTIIDAKFSLPFVVGTAFSRGAVGLADFTEAALGDSTRLTLGDRTHYEVDESLDWNAREANQGTMTVVTRAGLRLSKTIPYAYGHPRNPLSREALIEKFNECAGYAATPWSSERRERLIVAVLALEQYDDISPILDLL
jgi:2-methylcitrate dehydratase PrpD